VKLSKEKQQQEKLRELHREQAAVLAKAVEEYGIKMDESQDAWKMPTEEEKKRLFTKKKDRRPIGGILKKVKAKKEVAPVVEDLPVEEVLPVEAVVTKEEAAKAAADAEARELMEIREFEELERLEKEINDLPKD